MKNNFDRKRVLCVCSANAMRSPTMSWVLSNEPYNYDTRSCGIDTFSALIPLSRNLLEWAEEIVCADREHELRVKNVMKHEHIEDRVVRCLNIPDDYYAYDPKLIAEIQEAYQKELEQQ